MPRCRPPALSTLLAATLLTLAAIPMTAAAADPVKERSLGKGKAGGPLMTRAELRECLATQERTRNQATELNAEQEKLTAEKATLLKRREDLKERVATLDRTSAEAVGAYNADVTSNEDAVNAWLTRSEDFNKRAQAAQATRTDYVNQCENRRYDERDETAIRNGK